MQKVDRKFRRRKVYTQTPTCPHVAWRVRKYKCTSTWTRAAELPTGHADPQTHTHRRLHPRAQGFQGGGGAGPVRPRPRASSFRLPGRLSVGASAPPRPGRYRTKKGVPGTRSPEESGGWGRAGIPDLIKHCSLIIMSLAFKLQ